MGTKIAVIQKPPVLLHRERTIANAVESIDEAAQEGATLLVFSRGLHTRLPDLDLAAQARRRYGPIE
jgi:predicted amidohydrolase